MDMDTVTAVNADILHSVECAQEESSLIERPAGTY